MSGKRVPKAALTHLKAADRVLARVIDRLGHIDARHKTTGTYFDHIVRAIIYQQLSGKAAGTIHERVRGLFKGKDPTARELLKMSDEKLRSAGLSRQKLSYLKDLAEKVASKSVPIDTLHELDDEAVIEALVSIKGVGRWTAQMFLMFRLGRPDVLPTVDLGINKAIQREYKLRAMPKPREVLEIGAAWSPHATVACWYLWKSLDNDPAPPAAKKSKR